MSAIYLCQRVRLARPCDAKNLGLEGVVVYLGPVARGQFLLGRLMGPTIPSNCAVAWDGCAPEINPQNTAQLEPILPDGLESREEIDALYEPSPEVVTVEKRA